MILIEEIAGKLDGTDLTGRRLERIELEWYEAGKRIQRRRTDQGTEVAIRLMHEGQRLHQDDLLYADGEKVIVVDILPCDAIRVKPRTMTEMGSVCYEIGNKHLPVFIQHEEVLMPYEEPIFKWLTIMGYDTARINTKLLDIVNAGVQPHSHSHGGGSLLSKLLG